ncbi:restriction endonuclease [Methylomonas sp. HW2-6]|uniref:nSTAND3 domain-containing NTPase n=1 Tax=Methylomonas sp. HW2-6 TaxID=3376687 RepID=UPI004042CC5B
MDYDFKSLNDKEFEILCTDLLSEVQGRRFERFKSGKDAGVDGRYFIDRNKEVVLQCKHWSNTPLSNLIATLKKSEKPKLDKLKPFKYLLAVSNQLSRADKAKIFRALSPHLKSESDVYGKEDLNDLLRDKKHIEERHYKLWLHSSSILGFVVNNAILGRSAFSLDEIILASSRYVVTANHEAALKVLEKLGVVIITGEPGAGKTTLADHLCLHYVSRGYSYLRIADEIKEAESVFDNDTKQIIYFDDFLGRNYLDALKGHEGAHITQFIRRVTTNKNKRFVLTSRTTILNQGKLLIDSLDHANIKRNEYEIKIRSLSSMDKAHILYNHIWHSDLKKEYVEQIYLNKRYKDIINHKNFNPRLINYITDAARLDYCPHDQYWHHIVSSLENPSQVWENPFIVQLDDFCRLIVILIVLNGQAIAERTLNQSYNYYLAIPSNQNLSGRREFQSNIRLLTGSFINRAVISDGTTIIDLFNPSIGDYVLKRYSNDVFTLCQGFLSLRTVRSTIALRSLLADKFLSKKDVRYICASILTTLADNQFENASSDYVSSVFDIYKRCGDFEVTGFLTAAIMFVLDKTVGDSTELSIEFIKWGVDKCIITPNQGLTFIRTNVDFMDDYQQIKAMSDLLAIIPDDLSGYNEVLKSMKFNVIEIVTENFADFIDVNDAFSKVEYGDDKAACNELEVSIFKEFSALGVDISNDDVASMLEAYDVSYELMKFFENSYEQVDEEQFKGPVILSIDQIDDLFDPG